MKRVGHLQHVRVLGKAACFTRPEFRTERFSSVVPSVSAVEGLLSQVMGHKGARYEPESIGLLFQPRYLSLTGNEVRDFGDGTHAINTEDRRTLRTTVHVAGNRRFIKVPQFASKELRWQEFAGVEFILNFRLAADDVDYPKLNNMLHSRLRNGHFWRQPYLGMSSLTAQIEPVASFSDLTYPEVRSDGQRVPMPMYTHANGLRTADYDADLGLSFYGIDWNDPKRYFYFAPMQVRHGVLKYPTWDEVRALGIRREGSR